MDILFQNHAEWIWMVTKEAISNSSLQAYYGFIETQNKSFLKSRESFLRLSHLFITIRTGRTHIHYTNKWRRLAQLNLNFMQGFKSTVLTIFQKDLKKFGLKFQS